MEKIILILLNMIFNFSFSFFVSKRRESLIKTLIIFIVFSFVIGFTDISTTKILIIFLLNNIILFISFFKNIKNLSFKKRYILKILIVFLISIFLELTLFNFRSYTSIKNEPLNINKFDVETNLEKQDDGSYKVIKSRSYIEVKNINKKIKNVYFDINCKNIDTYYVIPFFTDKANKLYFQTESRQIHNKIEQSKTLFLDASGKSEKIKFEFTFEENQIININNIIINYKQPIHANLLRIIIVFIVLTFILVFNHKSQIYNIKYEKNRKGVLIILFLIIILSFSFLSFNLIRKYNDNSTNIYNNISNSLIEGKVYFTDDNNSEKLLNTMDNPYDYQAREKLFKDNNTYFLWDCAFYKGHYYSYFGVVPSILFFIPYKLITGRELQTGFLIYLLSLVSAISLVLLLDKVVKRYFKECSIGLFLLLSFVLVYCTGLLFFIKLPSQYTLPILSGLMFTYIGLNFFLSSLNTKKNRCIKFFFGGLFLALVAGCRPQLLLGSLLLIPICTLVLKENYISKKEMVKYITSIIVPYIIIAVLLMYYNYIRFDSPFDFGANYNLTTNDMTSRGFNPYRIPLGIVMYLFNGINTINVFPYIVETELHTNYLGLTIYESMYGGIFLTTIFTIVNLFVFKLKKYFSSKITFNTCIILIVSALVIVIVDTEMAGILARYINDFLWLLVFSAVLIVLSLNKLNKISKNVFIKLLVLSVAFSLIYQYFYYFVSLIDSFKNNNLRFWLEFYYMTQFWL